MVDEHTTSHSAPVDGLPAEQTVDGTALTQFRTALQRRQLMDRLSGRDVDRFANAFAAARSAGIASDEHPAILLDHGFTLEETVSILVGAGTPAWMVVGHLRRVPATSDRAIRRAMRESGLSASAVTAALRG